jgi:hypothetical protein
METVLARDHRESDNAEGRLIREMIAGIKDRLVNINNYTSFNSIRSFTPAEIELLIKHLDKCHEILWEVADLEDFALPFKAPKLIYAARELRKKVS